MRAVGYPDTRHERPGNVDSVLVALTSELEVMPAAAGVFSQADIFRNSSLSGASSEENHRTEGERALAGGAWIRPARWVV